MTQEKKRELENYGGLVLQCPLEMMYFKRAKTGILFEFNLWLDTTLFENDEAAFKIPELEKFSLDGENFEDFQAAFPGLIDAVDAQIIEIFGIDLSKANLNFYEVDAGAKIVIVDAPSKTGAVEDTKKIRNNPDKDAAGFDDLLQANKQLMAQVGSACLQFIANANPTGFFGKVLQIQIAKQ